MFQRLVEKAGPTCRPERRGGRSTPAGQLGLATMGSHHLRFNSNEKEWNDGMVTVVESKYPIWSRFQTVSMMKHCVQDGPRLCKVCNIVRSCKKSYYVGVLIYGDHLRTCCNEALAMLLRPSHKHALNGTWREKLKVSMALPCTGGNRVVVSGSGLHPNLHCTHTMTIYDP